jgi:hypothetical protein
MPLSPVMVKGQTKRANLVWPWVRAGIEAAAFTPLAFYASRDIVECETA